MLFSLSLDDNIGIYDADARDADAQWLGADRLVSGIARRVSSEGGARRADAAARLPTPARSRRCPR